MALPVPFGCQLMQGGAWQLRKAANAAAPPPFQPKILILKRLFLSLTVALSCAKIKIQESFSPLRASPTFMEIRCALNFQQRSWIPDCIEVIKSGKIFQALTFRVARVSKAYISYLVSLGLWSKQEKKFFATKEGKGRDLRFGPESKAARGGEAAENTFVKYSIV